MLLGRRFQHLFFHYLWNRLRHDPVPRGRSCPRKICNDSPTTNMKKEKTLGESYIIFLACPQGYKLLERLLFAFLLGAQKLVVTCGQGPGGIQTSRPNQEEER